MFQASAILIGHRELVCAREGDRRLFESLIRSAAEVADVEAHMVHVQPPAILVDVRMLRAAREVEHRMLLENLLEKMEKLEKLVTIEDAVLQPELIFVDRVVLLDKKEDMRRLIKEPLEELVEACPPAILMDRRVLSAATEVHRRLLEVYLCRVEAMMANVVEHRVRHDDHPPTILMDRKMVHSLLQGERSITLENILGEVDVLAEVAANYDHLHPPAMLMHSGLHEAAWNGDKSRLQGLVKDVGDHDILQGVTFEGDSALHIAARLGHDDLAEDICRHDRSVMLIMNKTGETALHFAARAGHVAMINLLTHLVQAEDLLKQERFLRARNTRTLETALHDAIRFGHVDAVRELVSADFGMAGLMADQDLPAGSKLVDMVNKDGASPLYLAASLGFTGIVRLLAPDPQANKSADQLHFRPDVPTGCDEYVVSYAGPGGQTALHAAVFQNAEMTKILLAWKEELAKEADDNGSTPLHLLASTGDVRMPHRTIVDLVIHHLPKGKLLSTTRKLLVHSSYGRHCAYRPDNKGLFPIHIAASVGALDIVEILLSDFPELAGLRDAMGRTFLHHAIQKKQGEVVEYVWGRRRDFAHILNLADNEGNTGLHLAVQSGEQWIFGFLMRNQEVCLNFVNNKGLTPLDIARIRCEGYQYGQNSCVLIRDCLEFAGAQSNTCRSDDFKEKHPPFTDEKLMSEKVGQSTQNLVVGSVLIATVTFAAAFTVPGGFIADDHMDGGAPTLAKRATFKAFTIFNTLAFVFSLISTGSLTQNAGRAEVDLKIRRHHLGYAIISLAIAVRCLVIAFIIGTYVMLTPVTLGTAIFVSVVACAVLLHGNALLINLIIQTKILIVRMGFLKFWSTKVHGPSARHTDEPTTGGPRYLVFAIFILICLILMVLFLAFWLPRLL